MFNLKMTDCNPILYHAIENVLCTTFYTLRFQSAFSRYCKKGVLKFNYFYIIISFLTKKKLKLHVPKKKNRALYKTI